MLATAMSHALVIVTTLSAIQLHDAYGKDKLSATKLNPLSRRGRAPLVLSPRLPSLYTTSSVPAMPAVHTFQTVTWQLPCSLSIRQTAALCIVVRCKHAAYRPFREHCSCREERGSSVGIAIAYLRVRRPRVRSSSIDRVTNFNFSISSRPTLGVTPLPILWVPGVKWLGREADHSARTRAIAKKT
jgi:hypothetical protein